MSTAMEAMRRCCWHVAFSLQIIEPAHDLYVRIWMENSAVGSHMGISRHTLPQVFVCLQSVRVMSPS